jgi:hypothetical protein
MRVVDGLTDAAGLGRAQSAIACESSGERTRPGSLPVA